MVEAEAQIKELKTAGAAKATVGAAPSSTPSLAVATGAPPGSWEELRKTLKEFTLNTQQRLEKERSALLVRCSTAETKLAKLETYVRTNLTTYQKEIVKLRTQLGSK